jgi:hypothetical protein
MDCETFPVPADDFKLQVKFPGESLKFDHYITIINDLCHGSLISEIIGLVMALIEKFAQRKVNK